MKKIDGLPPFAPDRFAPPGLLSTTNATYDSTGCVAVVMEYPRPAPRDGIAAIIKRLISRRA